MSQIQFCLLCVFFAFFSYKEEISKIVLRIVSVLHEFVSFQLSLKFQKTRLNWHHKDFSHNPFLKALSVVTNAFCFCFLMEKNSVETRVHPPFHLINYRKLKFCSGLCPSGITRHRGPKVDDEIDYYTRENIFRAEEDPGWAPEGFKRLPRNGFIP